jgi:hypothetical protein
MRKLKFSAMSVEDQSSTTAPDVDMDTNSGLDLGNVYKQCSSAHAAAITISTIDIENGSVTATSAPCPSIGSLNWEGDPSVLKTFLGGRSTKNGRSVNECLSVSFDPRNLNCLGCDKPLKPVVIAFADQNFVPFLSGGPENCVAIVRAENCSLNELGDLAAEILDKIPLPAGSNLLFGSGSHLL